MRPASRNMIVGGSLAFLAIVGGIYMNTRQVEPGGARYGTVAWDGPVPADVMCLRTTGLAAEAALALFKLDAGQPGPQYVYVRICASPVADAGDDDDVQLPPGMVAFDSFQVEEDYDGGPQMRASLDDFPCACSEGAHTDCEASLEDGGWAQAQVGVTLLEDKWRGSCRRKACVELAGVSSWPGGCPE